jgi:hypothetical protein
LKPIGSTTSVIPVPEAVDRSQNIVYVADDESTLILITPRDAIHGTTPPFEDEKPTADVHEYETTVSYDQTGFKVEVGMNGRWVRGAVGQKLNDLASRGWWQIVVGLLFTAVVALCRQGLTAAGKRLRTWVRGSGTTPSEPGDGDAGGDGDGGEGEDASDDQPAGQPTLPTVPPPQG